MMKSNDTMLEAFRKRKDPSFVEAYVQKLEKESAERRGKGQKNKTKRQRGLLKWTLPENVITGMPAKLIIIHKIPKRLGEQQLHVTLKDGLGKRIERKVLKVIGAGEIEVKFDVPKIVPGNKTSFSVFAGKDYSNILEHLTSKPIPIK